MRRLFLASLGVVLALSAPAFAFQQQEGSGETRLTRGQTDLRFDLYEGQGVTAGLRLLPGNIQQQEGPERRGASSLRMGGYAEYSLDSWRFDVGLAPDHISGTAADLGASWSAPLAQTGATYTLRVGAAYGAGSLSDSWFDADQTSLTREGDVNLSVTLSRPITSSLSVSGSAAARRTLPLDERGEGENQVRFGAGLGWRF
ncbi:MipA/OmpV family protein [Telmatospirillum sp. J64-1]|uniref:MipA/OmpV family protein n=1 Tax=Telmatospirillum sp. J64-1 TaxID=2502183 RepID=UPI00115DCF15|nr:MipA/OmpV family protein [Telmatospirillum sp. J64-1]